MTRFILFVARDGEAIVRSKTCPDLQSAERWAFETVREYFEIDDDLLEGLWDIASETDGLILMDFEQFDHSSKLICDPPQPSLLSTTAATTARHSVTRSIAIP